MFPRRNQTAGFSLIELVVIVAILSTLAALIAPGVTSFYQDSKAQQIVTMSNTLRDACMRYWHDNDAFAVEDSSSICYDEADPACVNGHQLSFAPVPLAANADKANTWDGPYIEEVFSSVNHPSGGNFFISSDFTDKTFTMGGAAVSSGTYLELDQISQIIANLVEQRIDPPVNNLSNGRVLYSANSQTLSILLIDG